mgnify:FL=1
MLYLCMGVLGAIIGSFMNVVSVRGARGDDFVHGRSYCPHCHHLLCTFDLIPILSYLFLRGKCRYCKQLIQIRYFLVELVFFVLFLLVAYLKSPTEIVGYFFCTICMLIALMDIDSFEVDLRLLFILAIIGFYIRMNVIEEAILSMIIGFILYSMVYGVGKWIWKEEVFGIGDVYYLTALGPFFSIGQILFIGLFSFVIGGGVVISWMLLFNRNKLHIKIPFAPFISMSALLTFLFSIQWI